MDLSKIFWSKSRAKLLEKFFLDYYAGKNEWFHMRGLARDLDEQINSIKRELDNLEDLWVLKSKTQLRKKIFTLNTKFYLISEFQDIFLKSYDPLDAIISTEDFFNRLSYWDKLIHNILREKGNIFLKDALKVKEKLN